MAILIIYHHFQNEWHIYPLKKTNHSEISYYCNMRALTMKKNPPKSNLLGNGHFD